MKTVENVNVAVCACRSYISVANVAEIENRGYTCVKTSWKRGYLSRRLAEPIIKPYNGRYGKGYTVEYPSWNSTQYHYISYHVQ